MGTEFSEGEQRQPLPPTDIEKLNGDDKLNVDHAEFDRLIKELNKLDRFTMTTMHITAANLSVIVRSTLSANGSTKPKARRHDGSWLIDTALPPKHARDAIASLDDQRERWLQWYGDVEAEKVRKRAAIRIVASYYYHKFRGLVVEAFRFYSR